VPLDILQNMREAFMTMGMSHKCKWMSFVDFSSKESPRNVDQPQPNPNPNFVPSLTTEPGEGSLSDLPQNNNGCGKTLNANG
jgi:hypothetical protein